MTGYDFCTLELARLRPTEEVDAAHVRIIAEEMERDGAQLMPLLVERESLAILDGHHRYRAAELLGLKSIAAVLIAYDDPRLTLASWTEHTFTRSDVLAAAMTGRLLPRKSTRHILSPPLSRVQVPLAMLASS